MCGIFGYASFNSGEELPLPTLRQALNTLKHRGPDGEGEYFNSQVYLGHRRLSIIDLSDDARQPFASGSGSCYLTYNGEIYNYRSLGSELKLRTRSDTEVLVEGYERFGPGFFLRLKGIYAFAILDEARSKLLLYRDPAGVKPLYYRRATDYFAFASEIKALIRIDETSLTASSTSIQNFLNLGFVPEPATIYSEIQAIEPGHLLELDLRSLRIEIRSLFQHVFESRNTYSFEENCEQTDSLLRQASARNQVADVKVNLALSGGIDSSLLTYYSRDYGVDKSITIRFNEELYNEVPTASAFAKHLGVNHVVAEVTSENHLDLLNELLAHFDQPYADSSLVPFYFLCREAAKHSKVLVGGDGGDEIHSGYSTHRFFPYLAILHRLPWAVKSSSAFSAFHRFLPVELARLVLKYRSFMQARDREELIFQMLSWFPRTAALYPINPFMGAWDQRSEFDHEDDVPLADELLVQKRLFGQRMISDYLRKADMMSMISGLEYRVPMLDEDLVSFSLGVPPHQKCTLTTPKKILRAIHSRYFPPALSRLKKKGFSVPLDTWLGAESLHSIQQQLTVCNSFVKEFVDPRYIDVLFRTLTNRSLQAYCSREAAYQRILVMHSLEQWSRRRRTS